MPNVSKSTQSLSEQPGLEGRGSSPTSPGENRGQVTGGQPVEQKVCPRCSGFVVWERYGFKRMVWQKCINCGWHGTWIGKSDPVLTPELVLLIEEVKKARRGARPTRGPIGVRRYKFT